MAFKRSGVQFPLAPEGFRVLFSQKSPHFCLEFSQKPCYFRVAKYGNTVLKCRMIPCDTGLFLHTQDNELYCFYEVNKMDHKLYSEIETIHSKIDFDKIWKGFSCVDFALYDQETVILKDKTIPWDQRFLGNTVIDFNGNYIAIWELESVQKDSTNHVESYIK